MAFKNPLTKDYYHLSGSDENMSNSLGMDRKAALIFNVPHQIETLKSEIMSVAFSVLCEIVCQMGAQFSIEDW